MNRTILYYPYIGVPDTWLKKSILYWDEIGSIIPGRYQGNDITPEMRYLESAGIFRSFEPSALLQRGFEAATQFEAEFREVINSEEFKRIEGGNRLKFDRRSQRRRNQHDNATDINYLRRRTTPIHIDKVSYQVIEFLERRGLAISRVSEEVLVELTGSTFDWFLVEKSTAAVYMSILAKYLADIDRNATVTGTSESIYHQLNYGPMHMSNTFYCYATTLHHLLPFPGDNVSFEDILEFKRRRQDELTQLRTEIQEFQLSLSAAESPSQIKDISVAFSEKIAREVSTIGQTMRELRLETRMGTLQTLVKMSVPTLLTGMAGPVLSNMGIAQVPVQISVAAAGLVGLINIGTYAVGRRNQTRAYIRNTPFAYLYYAEAEGLV